MENVGAPMDRGDEEQKSQHVQFPCPGLGMAMIPNTGTNRLISCLIYPGPSNVHYEV